MAQEDRRLGHPGVLIALVLGLGCRTQPQARPSVSASPTARPNVVLVSIDTLRADHCSAYGYAHPTTPFLEKLAAQGALVESAYAPMPTTGPSHATMMTGLYPATHGVVKNGYVLGAAHATLAETFAGAGYATAAFVSSFPMASKFGLAQGFVSYDDAFGPPRAKDPRQWDGAAVTTAFDRTADATAARVTSWLAETRPRDRPFFLFVHLFDPHGPYDPPDGHRLAVRPAGASRPGNHDAREIWKYDGEVHFSDWGLGQIQGALERARLADQTLLVLVGDHGEGLGQHGHWEHGLLVYEEAIRVPLVVRWPGRVPAGLRVPGPVPLVDLRPTLLELALGPGQAGRIQGVSQARVLTGAARADPDRPIFASRRFYEPEKAAAYKIAGDKHAVRVGAWKYLEAPEERSRELFELGSDPGELTNRVEAQPEKARALQALLGEWQRAQTGAPRQAVAAEDIERLRALGYVQ